MEIERQKKILNIEYGSVFGTYWMIYAIISSFASVFMLARGYSNSQIGMTLAAANILAFIMQPLIADFTDRSKRLGIIGVTEIMTALMMIFAIGMFVFKGGTLALCVVFVLLIGFHTVLQPLFNSLAFKLEECGIPTNYGVARAGGSLAYSIFVAILGTLVAKLGIIVLPVSCEIICALMILALILTNRTFQKNMKMGHPPLPGVAVNDEAEEEEEINLIMFIKRNKMFFLVNIGVIGLFFSNAILNNYMAQIVTDINGTTEDMGRILGIMAFLEIPTMVLFKRIKRKFSCQFLLKIASIGFTVKIGLVWLATSVGMLYFAQVFQIVSFALFLPGMVYFTGEIMSRGEAVKGQALFTTMITLTTIFSSLLGGWILDIAGAKALTLIATLATAAGAVLIIAVIDKVGRK
ncbi:MAG: MFS transporter [Firmicutes bacterium]|nr:MFS transporter [Bacillota bacterium]